MALKYIGMAVIFISCTAGGFYFSARRAGGLSQTERILSFFDYISEKLNVYKTPVEKIFASYRDPVLERCGFLGSLRRMGRTEGVYSNPWESALSECQKNGGLKIGTEEYKCASDFGRNLCSENNAERRRSMEDAQKRLAEIFAKKNAKSALESKLLKLSGGLVGLLICLLFL